MEHAIQAHKRRSDDNEQYSRLVCLHVERMHLEGRETEEDLASKLEKDFKDIGLDITRDAIERTYRIGPVITDVTLVKKPLGSRLLSSSKAGVIAQRFTELVKDPKVTDIGLTLPGDV